MALPAGGVPYIVQQLFLPPTGEVEGRIGHDVVRLELGVAVVEEGIGVEFAQIRLDSPDGQVHLCHLPGGGVGVLSKYRNLVNVAAMVLNELCGLDKHPARAAAGIVDAAIEGLQNLYQCADHTGGGVKFAGIFSLLLRKFGKAILVGAAQDILALAVLDHLNIGEQIDHFAQPALIQFRPSKVFGQNILEPLVLFLNTVHSIIDHRADFRRMSGGGNHLPPGVLRHEKDVFGGVLVLVFLKAVTLLDQFPVLGLKAV